MTTQTPVGAPTPYDLISLADIQPNPWQPRASYDPDAISELAADIARYRETRSVSQGLLQVPLGRRMPDGTVQLAAGHSRWQAFVRLAQTDPYYADMPVALGGFSDEEMASIAWSENAQRKDLTALEEARAIQRMGAEFGWSDSEVARRLGLDRSTVAKKRALLRLPSAVLDLLAAGQCSERAAAALLPLVDWPLPESVDWPDTRYSAAGAILSELPTSSSDHIRRRVRQWMASNSIHLAPKYSEDGDLFTTPVDSHVVEQPICTGCPMLVMCEVQGTGGREARCVKRSCWEYKRAILTETRLAAAAAASGLPASLDRHGMLPLHADVVATARASSCSRLRVIPLEAWEQPGAIVPGVDGVGYGCSGRNCACKASMTMPAAQTDTSAPPAALTAPATASLSAAECQVQERASAIVQIRTIRRRLSVQAALKSRMEENPHDADAWAILLTVLVPGWATAGQTVSWDDLVERTVEMLGQSDEDIEWAAQLLNFDDENRKAA